MELLLPLLLDDAPEERASDSGADTGSLQEGKVTAHALKYFHKRCSDASFLCMLLKLGDLFDAMEVEEENQQRQSWLEASRLIQIQTSSNETALYLPCWPRFQIYLVSGSGGVIFTETTKVESNFESQRGQYHL